MSRYYRYPKKKFKINKKFLIVFLSFILCVVLTVLYGQHLKKKAEESKLLLPDTTADESTAEISGPAPQRKQAPTVTAPPLTLAVPYDPAAFDEVVAGLVREGVRAVTVPLRTPDGAPTYASKIAAYPQNPAIAADTAPASDTGSAIPLETLVTKLHAQDLYICGYFQSKITNTAGYTAEFIRHYELALIGELHAAGIDEILLDGLSPTTANIGWVSGLYTEIHEKYPELLVGITVSPDAVFSDKSSIFFHTLSELADFIVLDLTGTETDAYKNILDNASLYFSKYNIRALVWAPDADTLAERLALLHDAAVRNYQILAAGA